MKKILSRLGVAAACSVLLALPVAAQGDPPATETPSAGEHGGSHQGGATDQQGTTHGDQIGKEGDREGTPREQGDGRARMPGATGTAGETEAAKPGDRTAVDDRTFITDAAAGSMAEVRFGHLGADMASSEEVKRFARQLVQDHAKINEDLMRVARELQIAEPHELKPEHQQTHERLSALSGAEFDRAFVAAMLEDHRKDLPMFRQQARSAQHETVRQFAQSKLPLLEQHFQRAQQLHRSLGGEAQPGGARGTSGATGTAGDRDRLYAGDDDQHRSDEHVHDEGVGGPEEQPGTSTGTPPQ